MASSEQQPAPTAVKSEAQSRVPHAEGISPTATTPQGKGSLYDFGDRLFRAGTISSYRRKRDDPLYRPLSIYALDPSVSKLCGAVAEVKVRYEELEPGPVGAIVEVDNMGDDGTAYPKADLNDMKVLIANGYAPSMSSPQFHQQMVYGVTMLTYADFKLALGREIPWAIPGIPGKPARLRLRPFGPREANAWYDRDGGEIVFGHFIATARTPVAEPNRSIVYTSLSHDVIVHEVSHALLDGLRAHFFLPSHPDVLAFHEAFADLIAFFQHFSYTEVVRNALSEARGGLAQATSLISLAQEFGRAIGAHGQALRTLALPDNAGESRLLFDPNVTEPHERGQALTRAIFLAFDRIYRRRVKRYLRLSTGGSGVLPEGEISELLLEVLVEEARKVADQFQAICIRAIDYCPPIDVRFGDYLRAIITADADLVPDDALAYRETLIRAFGECGIFGEGVNSMTEDALRWRPPRLEIPVEAELQLGAMHLTDDLAELHDESELLRLAGAIGRLAANPLFALEFGIVSPLSPDFDAGAMTLPVVESVRIARRIGPSQQVTLDLVAEVTQRIVLHRDGRSFPFYGGSTVILDATGAVRFIVSKRIDHEGRRDRQWQYIDSSGAEYWEANEQGLLTVDPRRLAKLVCSHRMPAAGKTDRGAGS